MKMHKKIQRFNTVNETDMNLHYQRVKLLGISGQRTGYGPTTDNLHTRAVHVNNSLQRKGGGGKKLPPFQHITSTASDDGYVSKIT